MHGLVAALGSAARHLTRATIVHHLGASAADGIHHFVDDPDVSVALLVPPGTGAIPPVATSPRGSVSLALSGYLLVDSALPANRHPHLLLEAVELRGLEAALHDVVAGSFNLAVVDRARDQVLIANDLIGSVALYYAPVPGGAIVTTIPGLLRLGGLLPAELDWTGVAEVIQLGHTIGDRYPIAGVRRLHAASVLCWDAAAARLEVRATDRDPTRLAVEPGVPDLNTLADLVEAACRRLTRLGGRVANLQSGGFDSRLVLAAWPRTEPLPCYSYGPADLADVVLGARLAEVRGSSFCRIPLPADAVAEAFDDMAVFGGAPVFPNRYLVGRRLSHDGFDAAVDGLMGDSLMGGSSFKYQHRFSRVGRYLKLTHRFVDGSIRRIGLDALTEIVLDAYTDASADAWIRRHLRPDIAARLAEARTAIRQDVWSELNRLAPDQDSAALLLRRFRMRSRSANHIRQQGVFTRRFVHVYYPLATDVRLLDAFFRVEPRVTAFHRNQIRLFRHRYPAYAEVPYAASLLPLKRASLAHRWGPGLSRRGLHLPVIKPRMGQVKHDHDEWHEWLQMSPALRARVGGLLAKIGLADADHLQSKLEDIEHGRERGAGELAHLAAFAHLLTARPAPRAAGPSRSVTTP
jgi:asparagine synthetase B (glutamine-hydrolysing)